MSNTKIKAGQFSGIVGHGTDGYFLMTNGDGTMAWAEGGATGPSVTSVSYPGDDLAADPAGLQTVVLTGTGFAASGMTVSIGGTTAPSVAHDSNTQLTITTPVKVAGDYDIVVTNTVTGASGTFVNGISYNGIPTWTTPTGSLGTFESETTISTITLQATEPDGGTITFNITNGALPTGLSLTGANIDGTTTAESSTTLYSFTIEAIDDENQATPRNFSITVNSAAIISSENFTINTYTGNGSTQSIEGKIGTAAQFNGSSSYISIPNSAGNNISTFSISFWFKTNGQAGTGVLFNNGGADSTQTGWYITISSSGVLGFSTSQGGDNQLISNGTTNYADNSWHNVVLVYTAVGVGTSTYNVYVDGNSTPEITGSNGRFTNTATQPLTIGRFARVAIEFFNGSIDQVRIFNKAISSSEVTTLYGENNASSTKSTTDIFDDGSGIALYEFEEGAKDTGTTPYGTGAIDGGQSAVFNNTNSYITVSSSACVTGNGARSATVWINKDTVAGFIDAIINYGANSTSQKWTWALTGNNIELRGYSNDFSFDASSYNIYDGNWHHLAVTFSGSVLKFYIDGIEATSTSKSYNTASSNLEIGREGSNYFEGKMDDLRFYSDELTASEIEYIVKNDQQNIPTDNLIFHYKLDGNGNDETTNYNATSVNNITYSDPAEFPLIAYNGTPTNVSFVGTSFQPDLVWVKSRSTNYDHQIHDSVRGAGNGLLPNAPNGENPYNTVTSFDSNGFTVDASSYIGTNASNQTFVAWAWKAGGTVTPNNNTNGTITSTVSANPDAGFSIVSYTGASGTVGHGLNSAPKMIIQKKTSGSEDWYVYFPPGVIDSNYNYLLLNSTAAKATTGSTPPTTTTFNPVSSSGNYIAYCFADVDGYQKVGSYGGGSTGSGAEISVGFEPRFVMIKRTDAVGGGANWWIWDNIRNPSSPYGLQPNLSNAEATDDLIRFTSTGFYFVSTSGEINNSGSTFIYLAIA